MPQETIVGPLFFILYIDKLNNAPNEGEIIFYADDSTFYNSNLNRSELEISNYIRISSFLSWFSDNNLKINNTK